MGPDFGELLDCRKRWLEWLDGDPLHSINSQLSNLLWHDAAFRIFNHARKLADPAVGASAISPLLAPALDQGYLDAMTIGTMKLSERSDPKNPKKGVVSLRRLVDEMMSSRHLFTRENYLAVDGYPYNYESFMRAEISEAADAVGSTISRGGGDPAQDWMAAERSHRQFDRLSGISPEARSPSDRIRDAVFERLDAAFDDEVFTRLRKLRNKVIAHAADAFSRGKEAPQGLSLDGADRALSILLGMRQAVQAGLLNDSWRAGAVPVPQYNQFEHLDMPFVSSRQIADLHAFWDEHSRKQEQWLSSGHEAFLDWRVRFHRRPLPLR